MSMDKERGNSNVAVIGFGITGQSCSTFLHEHNMAVSVFVSDPNTIDADLKNTTDIVFCTLHEKTLFTHFDFVVVSPGIDLKHPALSSAMASGVELISEIELFARYNDAPVIAVTGSNGKSTVVDMLHNGCKAANIHAGLGGNFGTPALRLLDENYALIILELSSFQLELTHSLKPKIACVLNVTEDHIDRHETFDNYANIKRRIYNGAEISIINRDDPATHTDTTSDVLSFGQSVGNRQGQSWVDEQGMWLGNECVISNQQLSHMNKHNVLNLQVAMLIGHQLLSAEQLTLFKTALLNYKALPHRFETFHEWVNEQQMPVTFIDDSKATNPGATITAINSVDEKYYLVLIVGGDSKQADIEALSVKIAERVDLLLCLGKDADLFVPMSARAQKFADLASLVAFSVEQVKTIERPAVVLLSPACASIDMFKNYKERGLQFQHYVRQCA